MTQDRSQEHDVSSELRADGSQIDYRRLAEELVAQHGSREFLRDMREMDRGVAGEQYVLTYLFDHDGSSHPTDVRRGMGVTSSRVAAILRCLERRGFVERTVDPADRRRVVVTLTDAGRACASERRSIAVERFALLLEQLGPDDAQAFMRLHRRVFEIVCEGRSAAGQGQGAEGAADAAAVDAAVADPGSTAAADPAGEDGSPPPPGALASEAASAASAPLLQEPLHPSQSCTRKDCTCRQ